MFIRIKNAYKAGHETALIPYSKFKLEIAKVLERAEYVGKVGRKGKRTRKNIEISLLYRDAEGALRDVKLVSRPSRRLYTSYRSLRHAGRGGIFVLSTPKGVMTDREARKEKVGGQVIAEVW